MGIFNIIERKILGFTNTVKFILLVLTAFLISNIPIINIPLNWIMTYFHEVSHGLVAILSGGSILKIVLYIFPGRQAGLCYTTGGISFLVAFSGYAGAVLWGTLIYQMADRFSQKISRFLSLTLALIIGITAILYGRDVSTWVILLILCTIFSVIAKFQNDLRIKIILKFIGIYVLLDAITAPLALVDGRHIGDGAQLSDLTGIPEIVWVFIWLIIGFVGIFYLWDSKKVSHNEIEDPN